MFIWRAERLMGELRSQLPGLWSVLEPLSRCGSTQEFQDMLAANWQRVPKVSLDYGIMEHADGVAVIPVDIGWSDVGDWASLLDIWPVDPSGNAVQGDTLLLDASANLVRGSSRLVAMIGVDHLVVVDTPDALLICARDRAQDVRAVVERLRQQQRIDVV
jgi:mannose-1-phosphate guanylyltransferase